MSRSTKNVTQKDSTNFSCVNEKLNVVPMYMYHQFRIGLLVKFHGTVHLNYFDRYLVQTNVDPGL